MSPIGWNYPDPNDPFPEREDTSDRFDHTQAIYMYSDEWNELEVLEEAWEERWGRRMQYAIYPPLEEWDTYTDAGKLSWMNEWHEFRDHCLEGEDMYPRSSHLSDKEWDDQLLEHEKHVTWQHLLGKQIFAGICTFRRWGPAYKKFRKEYERRKKVGDKTSLKLFDWRDWNPRGND